MEVNNFRKFYDCTLITAGKFEISSSPFKILSRTEQAFGLVTNASLPIAHSPTYFFLYSPYANDDCG